MPLQTLYGSMLMPHELQQDCRNYYTKKQISVESEILFLEHEVLS